LRVFHKLFSEQRHKETDEETAAYINYKSPEGKYPAPSLPYPESNDITGDSPKESADPYYEIVSHYEVFANVVSQRSQRKE